jgi:hypothetical protein
MPVKSLSIILALAAIAAATAADARPRKAPVAQGGGFLDLSEQARIAGKRDYFTQLTYFNRPIYTTFLPDSFGSDVLPGRFGQIGR